ncbi:NADPH-dependent F420 reductase [Variovorax sp. V118]|uniref:NADPH-dependent F420 reductase n=1 Tax=Variovorax sp. V118 TaxID=3065954 RepID=UPI0034E8DA9D
MSTKPTIAVVGGTGALGTGLALRWALAGHPVIVGSRTLENAQKSCEAILAKLRQKTQSPLDLKPMVNDQAAKAADIVAVTVPFAQQAELLRSIQSHVIGKILIDTTVPLMLPKVGTVQLPPEGSAAQIAREVLGESVRVVSAFHNVAADSLASLDDMDCDVLVFSDDKQARDEVVGLVEVMGARGFAGGGLSNSAAAEALTSVLITVNRQYKCHAGIRLTGIGD